MKQKNMATVFAILAAALYAINIPLSKMLLVHVSPTMLAAFLYLGAGVGLLLYRGVCRMAGRFSSQEPLTRKELPFTVAMVALDIAAPILLMLGLTHTSSANASLINNFEIVATSLIALFFFKEVLSRRLWLAIVLVTLASVILSFEGEGSLVWNEGSLLVLGACVCWGVENNCTKMLSSKSSVEIVIIKGIFSGLGSLAVALLSGEVFPALYWALAVMALGFVAYGLSINYYILAQRDLGAAKTSAYYALAPFLGVGFSMALLGERPALQFYIALALMAVSAILMTKDTIALQHSHLHTHVHSHEHSHNGHAHTHLHAHQHCHLHIHPSGDETHSHTHKTIEGHQHAHPLA